MPRPHRRSAPLIACLLTALVGAGPLSGCAEPASSTVDVAFIGDSLTEKTVPFLPDALEGTPYQASLYYGISGYSALSLLSETEQLLPELPDTVVLAVGTVDIRHYPQDEQRQHIEQVLNLLGPERRIIWVTVYRDDQAPNPEVPGPGDLPLNNEPGLAQAYNEMLEQAAQGHPNLEVAPWHLEVDAGRARTTDDGIHYTPESYPVRAQFYVRALLKET